MKKKLLINSQISVGSYHNMIASIIKLSQENKSSYICVSNVHMLVEAFLSSSFSKLLNDADIATPDGMPLAKAISFLYNTQQDRVAGMNIMPDLISKINKTSLSIYLYGSTEEILTKIKDRIKDEYPNVNLCGTYSPPFRELTNDEKTDVIKKINSLNPDFVFVALGCPKQEKWMAEHKNKIHSCMIGLGGAFEVFAKVKSRAPQWMQNYSLEWLHRLAKDPKRLWKRYLFTNSIFIFLLLKQILDIKVFKKITKLYGN